MKRLFIILCVGLTALSCWSRSDRFKVDIDKALKHPGRAQDVYAETVSIPLQGLEGIALGQEIRLLDVTADRFFLLDKEKNEILIFDWNGQCATMIAMADSVIDFSVYRDRVLDVLTEEAIIEYSTTDGTFLAEYPIRDLDVMLKRVARVTEDGIFMLGTQDGYAYDVSYLISKSRFYPAARPASDYLSTHAFVPASECQNSRFFRCDGIVYSFGSRSGQIAQYTDDYFICVPYQWDFGKRAPVFTNVQKTTGKIYLAFALDGKDYVLVYNLDNRRYKVVDYDTFPLGVIYAGRNYYFSPADRAIICHTL
ncbi:MAG: hypothetical protein IKM89_07335 [Bacteroidales bacterium]|nr:hypothetical protein [Bacteroidales bacterium]